MAAYVVVFVAFLLISLFVFKDKKLKKLSFIVLGAVLFVEIFGMNFNALRSLFQKEEAFSVSVTDESVSFHGNSAEVGGGRAVPAGADKRVSVTVP